MRNEWTYYKWGRVKVKNLEKEDNRGHGAIVFVSTSHCSAGCSFGDVVGVPIVAIKGLTIAGSTLFAHYTVEFLLAYLFGVIFQFYSIYPMNKEDGKLDAFKQAVKADSLSMIAFEVGMFWWMDVVHYLLFTEPANQRLIKKGLKEAM
jgi:Domain of unknown function (DUF4396)